MFKKHDVSEARLYSSLQVTGCDNTDTLLYY
jgi:hypothetical protein